MKNSTRRENDRMTQTGEQALDLRRDIPLGMQLAGVAALLLWRGYYFFTVVVIPALGWR
jgi:hypothetical protein